MESSSPFASSSVLRTSCDAFSTGARSGLPAFSTTSVNGPLQGHSDWHDFRVPGEASSEGLAVTTIERLDCRPHDFDVRQRHRLLLQPCGFEGFGLRPVLPDFGDLACEHPGHMHLVLLERCAAGLSATFKPNRGNHVVTPINDLLQFDAKLSVSVQLGQECTDAVVSPMHRRARIVLSVPPFTYGIEEFEEAC